jgi:hypothetical protein
MVSPRLDAGVRLSSPGVELPVLERLLNALPISVYDPMQVNDGLAEQEG